MCSNSLDTCSQSKHLHQAFNMASSNNLNLNSDSSDNEAAPEVNTSKGQFVVGKIYCLGKLLSTPIGNETIFKDASKVTVITKCHLTVIMRHDEEMKHPSLAAEWKVQRILLKKFMLSHDFMISWTKKEVLTVEFVGAIEQLPCIFTPERFGEFKAFFDKYGHGFLKSGYVGGEVYLKITDKENFDNINYDSEEEPLLKMKVDDCVFRGGNPIYHNISKEDLKQWRESLYDNPVELILDQEMDVVFYHDFVPMLTWLRNRRARGEALEEALMVLEDNSKNTTNNPDDSAEQVASVDSDTMYPIQEKGNLSKTERTQSLLSLPSFHRSISKAENIGTRPKDTLGGKSQTEDSDYYAAMYPIGNGYNIFGNSRVKESVLRRKYIGDFIQKRDNFTKEERTSVEKLFDHPGGVAAMPTADMDKNQVIEIGSDSFVLKVARSRHCPSHKKLLTLFANERGFNSRFKAKLKRLPRRYNSANGDSKEKFKSFFDSYGQGLLVNSYHGGEVGFRVINDKTSEHSPGSVLLAEEIHSAVSKLNPKTSWKLTNEASRYEVNFAGGQRDLKHISKLPEWTESLKTDPCQIMLDYERDIFFFHELVMELSWLPDCEKRAEALEEAFTDIYLNRQPKEMGVQESPTKKDWSWWSMPMSIWSLTQSAISSSGGPKKKERIYKPFDF